MTKVQHILAWTAFGAVFFGAAYAYLRQELRRDASWLWVIPLAIYTYVASAYLPARDPIRITADDLPMPTTPCDVPKGAFRVYLGPTVVSSDTDAERFVVISSRDRELLSVSSAGGTLVVSAQVFDDRGLIVAEVSANELVVNANNSFKVKQPDKHEFQVFDQRNLSALRVRMINSNAAVVTGRFFTPSGNFVDVSESHLTVNGQAFSGWCFHNNDVGLNV